MNFNQLDFPWFKNRGYLHVSPQVNLTRDKKKIISLLKNEKFIAEYAFFPLIHTTITERRFKKINAGFSKRAHTFTNDSGQVIKNLKNRPLHYASHFDAIIFGYYAEIILDKYEKALSKTPNLSECIIAYRRIPTADDDDKNKSTIHFANDTFNEIKKKAHPECEVLTFDIKSFFSRINHQILKDTWANLLGETKLPPDHYNVYKAATRFSYILKDDFRLASTKEKRAGFDEKKLSQIRKKGVNSFFETAKNFRNSIKNGELKLHKYPFRDSSGDPVGIPQGLPISAVLANLYLLPFDLDIFDNVVIKLGAYYRRYSDDIIIICEPRQAAFIENYVNNAINDSKVEISKDKTERFLFKKINGSLVSFKITKEGRKFGIPFTYLGFEFYGDKTLIKSTNLSKFYRRMIKSVKTKAQRALNISTQNPEQPLIIFRRRLYKLYIQYPLKDNNNQRNYKRLVKNSFGDYHFKIEKKRKINNSNYLTYVHRASEIMNDNSIKLQIRNHNKIFNQAISKYLNKAKNQID